MRPRLIRALAVPPWVRFRFARCSALKSYSKQQQVATLPFLAVHEFLVFLSSLGMHAAHKLKVKGAAYASAGWNPSCSLQNKALASSALSGDKVDTLCTFSTGNFCNII